MEEDAELAVRDWLPRTALLVGTPAPATALLATHRTEPPAETLPDI